MRHLRWTLCVVVLGLACEEEGTPSPTAPPPADVLPLPDLEGLDMAAALQEALGLALSADLRAPWAAHAQTLDLAQEGCPDFYVGDLAEADLEDLGDGYAWVDRCRTGGGLGYSGALGWTSSVEVEGDATTDAGQTTVATRRIGGDGIVDDNEGVLLELDGEGEDNYYESRAPGYLAWTYTSRLAATLTGRYPFGATPYPGGWRQDLYLRYSRGAEDSLEIRGNLYLFEDLFDRFDSLSFDFQLQGQVGASPEECLLEPSGILSLRDPNAFWYDVVFLPRNPDQTGDDGAYENPLSGCEGCGTLYVRGVEVGPLCVDFSPVWAALLAPEDEAWLLPLR